MTIQSSDIFIQRSATIRDALLHLDRCGFGILIVISPDGRFDRTLSDGDIRRLLLQGHLLEDKLESLANIDSFVLQEGFSQREALELLNKYSINHLPVLDANRRVIRVLDRKELDTQILLSTPHMGAWERDFVDEAFKTNWIAPLGPNVDAFEKEIAEYVNIGHAAAVNSGTAAIHLALQILGVGAGDTVLCSSLTFAASCNPIVYLGAEPVFVDSEPDSWNMSPAALERAILEMEKAGRKPKVAVIVNLYGQSADMDPLVEICRRHGVLIVEDAAESLGAKYKNRASGTFGDIGVYSFNGNKIITTSGGGMMVSDNLAYMEEARFLATQARDPAPHYQHSRIGYNYRMSNILAGVGRGQIRVLDERIAARRGVYDRYREELADFPELVWMPEPEWSYSTHWLTACTLDAQRTSLTSSKLIASMAAEFIEARPIWKPMHLQPVFAHCKYFSHGERSVCDDIFETGVCLPSGSNMADEQLNRIIKVMKGVLRSV